MIPTSPKPHLLFLGQKLPWPLDSGARIRTYHLLRELAQDFAITGLFFHRIGDSPASAVQIPGELAALGSFDAVPIPQETSRLRLVWDHVRSIVQRRPYTVYVYRSRGFEKRLETLLGSGPWQLIIADSLDLSGWFGLLDARLLVCGHHDVESAQLEKRATVEPRWWKRNYIKWQARRMHEEERRWCPRVALNLMVSEPDRRRLATMVGGRYAVIPNGADIEAQATTPESVSGCLFVGSSSWLPNRDAMEFFVRDILPSLQQRVPNVAVTWVGNVTGRDRRELEGSGIRLSGYVDDVRPWIVPAACCIVPLRAGSGTRLKILEAWAFGKAVVSTTVGCEGLEAVDGENILVRDDPVAFAGAVAQVLEEPSLRDRLGENGRRTVERRYDWRVIGRHLRTELEALNSVVGE